MWKRCVLNCAMIVVICCVSCTQKIEQADEAQIVSSEKGENMTTDFTPTTPLQHIAQAIMVGDLAKVKSQINEHPEMLHYANESWGNWVMESAANHQKDLIEWFLDQGVDINCTSDNGGSSALEFAIWKCDESPEGIEIVRLLLDRGADPNLGRTRTPISALNCTHDGRRLQLLKLLVEYGADINRVYTIYGDKNNLFTALDWASGECAEYLRSVGAKTSQELKAASGASPTPEKPISQKSAAEQVVDYFTREVGPVQLKSLTEIVPAGTPISVHVIPAAKDRPYVTLFTTGLSSYKMNVPQVQDDSDVKQYLKNYEFAELYIQLPSDWKYDRLDDPDLSWPIMQLRWLGKYPQANHTWLGAPATVMSRDPVEPLAPNTTFDSLLLLPDRKFQNAAGETVQLYRLVPLYPDERALEAQAGLPALMRALDKIHTPMVVDMTRTNAAK